MFGDNSEEIFGATTTEYAHTTYEFESTLGEPGSKKL
jgi:hypothetical protein